MPSLNKVTIIGHLGRDPEVRTFQNGGQVCNFSVATSEKWKDKASGEMKQETEWHTVSVFNERIIKFAERLKKGSTVYVEGQLKTRKYTGKDGTEKYATEIVLKQYRGELLDFTPRSAEPSPTPAQTAHSAAKADGYAYDSRNMDADEIPF